MTFDWINTLGLVVLFKLKAEMPNLEIFFTLHASSLHIRRIFFYEGFIVLLALTSLNSCKENHVPEHVRESKSTKISFRKT